MGRTKQFSRAEVLAKAIPVFWKNGFKDTTLQDLEKATGVNKSGLYSEFKDKDDLFTAGLRYAIDSSGVMELLSRKPLGWKNIEQFLLSGQDECHRGCFIVNSVREFSILPAQSRAVIKDHFAKIRAAVRANVEAADCALNAERATDLILTYNAGLRLKQNLGDDRDLLELVKSFLKLLRAEPRRQNVYP